MNGLQSIPRTHQGEQLSYISPQEAQLLRQHGGGVAPDGGQLRGPGGIPRFEASDFTQKAAADMAFFQQMLPEYTSVQHLNQSKGSNYAQAGHARISRGNYGGKNAYGQSGSNPRARTRTRI
jgi:hypothetical protein